MGIPPGFYEPLPLPVYTGLGAAVPAPNPLSDPGKSDQFVDIHLLGLEPVARTFPSIRPLLYNGPTDCRGWPGFQCRCDSEDRIGRVSASGQKLLSSGLGVSKSR